MSSTPALRARAALLLLIVPLSSLAVACGSDSATTTEPGSTPSVTEAMVEEDEKTDDSMVDEDEKTDDSMVEEDKETDDSMVEEDETSTTEAG